MDTFGAPRTSGIPSTSTSRKVQLLVALIRCRRLLLQQVQARFGVSERTLLRDLQELRQVGKIAGFEIGERTGSDYVELLSF